MGDIINLVRHNHAIFLIFFNSFGKIFFHPIVSCRHSMTSSRLRFVPTLLGFVFLSPLAMAQPDIQINGTLHQPLDQTVRVRSAVNAQSLPASVTLLKMQLSTHAWNQLMNRTDKLSEPNQSARLHGQQSVQLGMNQVPVLDQGQHGTCATFANAAALDAVLNQGDYISELCVLQLGNYLEKYGYGVSGWDGSMGPWVLNQMQSFGIVDKQTQLTRGCGGLTTYPSDSDEAPDSHLSLADYHALSDPTIDGRIAWSSVLDMFQVYVDDVDPDVILQEVIKALNAGDRLTFGVLLFDTELGTAGAVGKHRVKNDSWILTPKILKSIKNHGEYGGHEMIITGYDDNAVAVDAKGNPHQGLLTLRNSWGSNVGDQGDFYMSYDYFKLLAIEVQRIRQVD